MYICQLLKNTSLNQCGKFCEYFGHVYIHICVFINTMLQSSVFLSIIILSTNLCLDYL